MDLTGRYALRDPSGAVRDTRNSAGPRLKAHGFADGALARIHGPVGLAIGARSPEEIAVSILAQMTERLRMRS